MAKQYSTSLLILVLTIIPTIYGGTIVDEYMSVDNITKMSYDYTIYVEYDENNTPTVYIYVDNNTNTTASVPGLIKYYIVPIKVCTIGINESLLSSMNFKINKTNYDVLISNKYNDTDKNAIFFTPIDGSIKINETKSTIYWNKDPLNYKTSEVIAKYKLPNKGEVVATYNDGSPACIMMDNKIYCGFEPNRDVLNNLLYIFMIKKIPYAAVSIIITLSAASGLSVVSPKFRKFITDVGSYIIVGRICFNNEEKVLLNDTRRDIYNCIIDNPGIHLRGLSKKLGKGISTITWHLRILEKADLIRSKKMMNRIVYYPKGMDISDLPLLYLNNETSQKVFKYILHNPTHLRKIAEDLDLPVETVRYNLKKMEDMNLIYREESGNKTIYYANHEYL